MKRVLNNINFSQAIKVAYFIILFLAVTHGVAHADIGDPSGGGSGGGGGSFDPDAAPIDGGLSLLVAAGVGYGAKRIIKRRKNYIHI